jgi:hypothetical protein
MPVAGTNIKPTALKKVRFYNSNFYIKTVGLHFRLQRWRCSIVTLIVRLALGFNTPCHGWVVSWQRTLHGAELFL